MRIRAGVLGAIMLVVGTPIAVAAADTQQPAERRKERRICRRQAVTGTRLVPPRVCMTQREWDGISERAKEDMGLFQDRQRVAVPTASGVSRCPPAVPC